MANMSKKSSVCNKDLYSNDCETYIKTKTKTDDSLSHEQKVDDFFNKLQLQNKRTRPIIFNNHKDTPLNFCTVYMKKHFFLDKPEVFKEDFEKIIKAYAEKIETYEGFEKLKDKKKNLSEWIINNIKINFYLNLFLIFRKFNFNTENFEYGAKALISLLRKVPTLNSKNSKKNIISWNDFCFAFFNRLIEALCENVTKLEIIKNLFYLYFNLAILVLSIDHGANFSILFDEKDSTKLKAKAAKKAAKAEEKAEAAKADYELESEFDGLGSESESESVPKSVSEPFNNL